MNEQEDEENYVIYHGSHPEFDGELEEYINSDTVWLNGGQWIQLKMDQQCEYIKSWKVEFLEIDGNEHSSILKELSSISFEQLKFLNLAMNKIQSIETLGRIQFQTVDRLDLTDNMLGSVRVFAKMKAPKLQNLILNENSIINPQKISTMDAKCLSLLSICDYAEDKKLQDGKWLAKINAVNFKEFNDEGFRGKTIKVLRRKHLKLVVNPE